MAVEWRVPVFEELDDAAMFPCNSQCSENSRGTTNSEMRDLKSRQAFKRDWKWHGEWIKQVNIKRLFHCFCNSTECRASKHADSTREQREEKRWCDPCFCEIVPLCGVYNLTGNNQGILSCRTIKVEVYDWDRDGRWGELKELWSIWLEEYRL